jgi:hypothetical protein
VQVLWAATFSACNYHSVLKAKFAGQPTQAVKRTAALTVNLKKPRHLAQHGALKV